MKKIYKIRMLKINQFLKFKKKNYNKIICEQDQTIKINFKVI